MTKRNDVVEGDGNSEMACVCSPTCDADLCLAC